MRLRRPRPFHGCGEGRSQGVDPRGRTPGRRVRGNEKVCAGNDSPRRCAANLPRLLGNVTETTRRSGLTVGSHKTSVGEHPGHHEDGTDDEHRAATPTVHEEESGNGHQDVDDVLDGTGDKVDVTGETSHTEDVCDVVL